MPIKNATGFSALIFAPVYMVLLLLALFMLPGCILFSLIAVWDPTVPLSSALAYNVWIIGPLMLGAGLFFTGRCLYSLQIRGSSPFVVILASWVFFSGSLFIAFWICFIILTSVGASETPPQVFLGITAIMAAGMMILAQTLIIPWLVIAWRCVIGGLPHTQFARTSALTLE